MGALEDIKQMQQLGKSDTEIRTTLKQQGVAEGEIDSAMSQSKIKDAISADESAIPTPSAPTASTTAEPGAPQQPITKEVGELSLMAGEAQVEVPPPTIAAPPPQPAPAAALAAPPAIAPAEEVALAIPEMPMAPAPGALAPAPGILAPAAAPGYQYPAASAAGLSTDTITEISEQVMAEKLMPIRNQLEKILDLKTTLESKQEALDERLKRIEKIIDRLQLSILQKLGDYVSSVENVKKELVETQKSFKAAKKPAKHKPVEHHKKKMFKNNHKAKK